MKREEEMGSAYGPIRLRRSMVHTASQLGTDAN